ncbi:MAG TPA: hypothetical protein VHF06_29250, partial [Pseudonocardiaceae bacterium]|nr:hypothetical protein [Pseudonocardiaceae bacterium]
MQGPRLHLAALGLSAVALVGALASCSSGRESTNATANAGGSNKTGTITIAYLQKQGDQQYFVDEANGAKQEAARLGNVKIDVVDLGTDSNQAI